MATETMVITAITTNITNIKSHASGILKITIMALCSLLFSANFQHSHAIFGGAIDIYGTPEKIIPISISKFTAVGAVEQTIANTIVSVVANDLTNSDAFIVEQVDGGASEALANADTRVLVPLGDKGLVNHVSGTIVATENGKYKVTVELWDVFSSSRVSRKSYVIGSQIARKAGHAIADSIMLQLTGRSGLFLSKIIYVSETESGVKKLKKISIMDQDGYNNKDLTTIGTNITPFYTSNWHSIAYVEMTNKRTTIKLINIATGAITSIDEMIPFLRGKDVISPEISPDGQTLLCVVLSNKESNIYSFNLKDGSYRQLTKSGINVSPSWSPDGSRIVYSSNISGKPSLYIMHASGWDAKRISSGKGSYYEPSWSPDGKYIAFTKILSNVFYIGIIDADTEAEKILNGNHMSESPSWSPDSREVIFSFKKAYNDKNKLKIVSITGLEKRILGCASGGASDPLWIMPQDNQ